MKHALIIFLLLCTTLSSNIAMSCDGRLNCKGNGIFKKLLNQKPTSTAGMKSISVNGTSRYYKIYIPPKSATKELSVLIAYHPALGSAKFMEVSSKLHQQEKSDAFIVIYPEGIKKTWNAGACCGLAKKEKVQDLAFFDALMEHVSQTYNIKKKAYIAGYSNGALMAYHLACNRPEKVAAIAPFGAYPHPDTLTRCKSSSKASVSLFHMHGQADKGAPVDGGKTKYLGVLPPLTQTIRSYARHAGCSTAQTTQMRIKDLDSTCTSYQNCRTNSEVTECIIPGLGHAWPGMKGQDNGPFGPARQNLNGSDAVLDYFLRH